MSASLHSQARFQRLSSICALACLVAAAVLPLLNVATWGLGSAASIIENSQLNGDVATFFPVGVQPIQRLGGAVVSLIPTLIFSYGLLRAGKALTSFALGQFFSPAVHAHLTAYAAAMFFAAAASFLEVPLLTLAVTLPNAPGQRLIALGVSSSQILWLTSAGVLWLIAKVAAHASALARENEQFV